MTKKQLEYWHEQLDLLILDMGSSPRDTVERSRWADTLLAVSELRTRLRLMHGDWKNSKPFRRAEEERRKRREQREL